MSGVPTSPIEIYIPLLDEGVDVVRPTEAKLVGPQEYLILPTPNYDPETETWEFLPGSVVQCRRETWSSGEILVARTLLRRSDESLSDSTD
jgi:hypothetical protein